MGRWTLECVIFVQPSFSHLVRFPCTAPTSLNLVLLEDFRFSYEGKCIQFPSPSDAQAFSPFPKIFLPVLGLPRTPKLFFIICYCLFVCYMGDFFSLSPLDELFHSFPSISLQQPKFKFSDLICFCPLLGVVMMIDHSSHTKFCLSSFLFLHTIRYIKVYFPSPLVPSLICFTFLHASYKCSLSMPLIS